MSPPAMRSPAMRSPTMRSPTMRSPTMRSPTMRSPQWSPRLARWLAPVVPAQRLALARIIVFGYACVWLVSLGPDIMTRARLPSARFVPVGLATATGVVEPELVRAVLGLTTGLGLLVVAGRGPRAFAPLFAGGLGWLLSYRNSWGHMSHAEHLLVLHVGILAMAPVYDGLRLGPARRPEPEDDARFGWPLRLMMLVTVSTYAIAGLAKLRLGGLAWLDGEVLRRHVAHELLRTRMVGASSLAVGAWLAPYGGVLTGLAVGTAGLELGAPLALWSGRLRRVWIGGLWLMHVGMALVMGIGFPYPLSGVAFVAFWPLERGLARARRLLHRRATTLKRAG